MATFRGFDHIDTRVSKLAAVEPFYDRLMPALGLTKKRYARVDAAGEWHEAAEADHNTVEYIEDSSTPHFIGFIEDPQMVATATRVAFRIGSLDELRAWQDRLREMGAVNVELSADMEAYPAIFFEDPAGTKLELKLSS